MRVDKNYMIFTEDEDWYDFQKGVGYVPTEKTPDFAVEAMKKYNSYSFDWSKPLPRPEDRVYV